MCNHMYPLIDPPFDCDFAGYSSLEKKELKEYNEWFFQIKSDRLEILTKASGITEEIMFTVGSLKLIGEWLVNEVNKMKKINDFTGLLSRGYDIAIYLGEFIIKNHPGAYWVQDLKDRRYIDFGEIVVRNFEMCDVNTILICYNIVTSMQDGESKPKNQFYSGDSTNIFFEWYEVMKESLLQMKTESVYFESKKFDSQSFSYTYAIKTSTGILAKQLSGDVSKKIEPLEVELSKDEWMLFISDLYRSYFSKWNKEYYDKNISDGEQWKLEISFSDGEKRTFSGNTYPPDWNWIMNAMSDIKGSIKRKLRRLNKLSKHIEK